MALENLEKLFTELNSPKTEDGETFESEFDFDYQLDEDKLYIFDKNEVYNINYAEDMYYLALDMFHEFGREFNLSKPTRAEFEDTIFPRIQEAVKKDGFGDLDWETNVRMICVKNAVHDAQEVVFNVYENGQKISSHKTKNEAFNAASGKDNIQIKMERVVKDSVKTADSDSVSDVLEEAYEEFKKCYGDGSKPEYSEKFYELINRLTELSESSEKELMDYFVSNFEVEKA